MPSSSTSWSTRRRRATRSTSPSRCSSSTTSRIRRSPWPRSRRLLRPGGRIALADLDTEDGTFHDADAEGIYHLGFGRDALAESARAAGFADVAFESATEIERDGRRYPLFLLLARRP